MTSTHHRLIRGAFLLTLAGLISRLMGFFFRIFLSHTFGEEQVGLYQLIFPLYTLCLSLGTVGIETALSRSTARSVSLGQPDRAVRTLYAALLFTVVLSFVELGFLQNYASEIAVSFLGDGRCAEMILAVSYALPFASIHCCLSGYCFGMQQSAVPAASQLVEQTLRILFVVSFYYSAVQTQTKTPSVVLAAAGIAAGEIASALFSACILAKKKTFAVPVRTTSVLKEIPGLVSLSLPLTANRTAVTLLQSIEAVSIPVCLRASGMSGQEALSVYGVLTGMALPCILFPSAITSSVATVLMPEISRAQARQDRPAILRLLLRSAGSCFILGLSCCLFFLLAGPYAGALLFHSELAGKFILTLAWICPFLYTNAALISTINGLGKTGYTLLVNMAGLGIRIAGVFLGIPHYGIQGYLWGLLASQITSTVLGCLILYMWKI